MQLLRLENSKGKGSGVEFPEGGRILKGMVVLEGLTTPFMLSKEEPKRVYNG